MNSMPAGLPLQRFKLAETGDFGEFEEAIRPIFGEVRFERSKPLKQFCGKANYTLLADSGLYYGQYGTQVRIAIPHANFIAQGVTLEGYGINTVNGVEQMLDTSVLPNAVFKSSRVRLDFDDMHRHLAFCIRPEALHQKIEALTGSATDKRFYFSEDAKMSAAELGRFRRLLLLLVSELDSDYSPPTKVFLKEIEQALMVSFLVGYQHNFTKILEGRPSGVAPWQVKRVEQHIEENWNQPLTIEAISAAVNASVRSIQLSFRSSRGYTPMEFARRVRLRHAREMLLNPDDATSVTDVAYACSFGNLGHFSKCYFDEFHELPSVTLSRAKGQSRRHQ